MNDDEDDLIEQSEDTQYMLSQDPGYLLWMLQQEQQYKCEQMQQEHSESILSNTEEFDWDKFIEEEERYWAEWDETHGEQDNE